ncbi:MAG: hypothetical protein LBE81_12560 [Azonexus sp.]|jgi:hypothetical protein|uniref:hypothetical protein n=1 Tax=Azonexus sp. TaxID=1872668 RepID=UPI002838DF4B|nr:hypothetical protein [Azonexus sp.]MDR0777450.1 hypothetical protein [Azonexus sp.]
MQSPISLDNAPPLAAPFRFFLTAPLFLVLAGLLLIVAGSEIFASRWMPATLALVHLITIGFMLQVMIGALIQVLPVVAGADLRRPLPLAWLVHAALTAGTPLLAAGFLVDSPALLRAAAVLLALGIGGFLLAAIPAVFAQASTSPTIRGLKLSLLGLAGVVALGVTLALGLAHGWLLPYPELTDLHAGWGLVAWAGVLLAAMAYVVVPMFQLTPGYPARPSWWLPPLLLALMLLWSLAVALGWPLLARLAQGALAVCGLAFAGLTLRLQAQRRRARADATSRYWLAGLLAALGALSMFAVATVWPAVTEHPAWTPLFAILLLAGAFISFIAGMLYKIVPFLTWLHLQQGMQPGLPVPNMNRLLPDQAMQRQMFAYLAALALLAGAALRPLWLARPAGAMLAVAGGWLWWNLLSAAWRYTASKRH